MPAPKLIGLSLILLLGLPSLIAAIERRRIPDLFHFILGLAGLVWSWATGGIHGVVLSLSAGILVLVALTIAVAFTQRRWGRRILAGGELKLMTAAALWLTPPFAVATIVVVLLAAIIWMLRDRVSGRTSSRPDLAPFLITALLAAFAIA